MLGAESSRLAHAWQNLQLLVLSLIFLPLDSALLVLSLLLGPYLPNTPERYRRHVKSTSTPYLETKTILVTGVGMTKGLALARLFYAAGHNVIGADFEPPFTPKTAGRVSRSLKTFCKLQKPDGSIEGSARYIESLLTIIRDHKVDMWVSCSGVASAVDDGKAKETIELVTTCKAVQFDVETTKTLHEKHTFMDFTKDVAHLPIPETYNITSHEAAVEVLIKAEGNGKKYIMKFIGTDDTVRGNMTTYPLKTRAETANQLKKLPISPSRPWILQQYIPGPEYCTHALIINNKVLAFVACPSAELLMHYEALPEHSALSQSMLRWTRTFADSCAPGFTGHCSFDFLVYQSDADAAARGELLDVPLWPIECNPRAHTAVALFADTPAMISKGYMRIFEETTPLSSPRPEHDAKLNGFPHPTPIYPSNPQKYYWLPHDLYEFVLQPVIAFLTMSGTFKEVIDGLTTFMQHLIFWRDGTFEIWDPLPAWWLWHVSWPWVFLTSLLTGYKWSRINVSTMKVFGC